MNIDAETSQKNSGKNIHSILISRDILTWTPQGKLFIMEETFLVLTSTTFYNMHFYHTTLTFLPRGLDLFTKGLTEAGINTQPAHDVVSTSKFRRNEVETSID
jgi:hypothetical protein